MDDKLNLAKPIKDLLWVTHKSCVRIAQTYVNLFTSINMTYSFVSLGDAGSRNDWISRLKMDVCDPAGCLYELCIMLAIYMVIRQVFSNLVELFLP